MQYLFNTFINIDINFLDFLANLYIQYIIIFYSGYIYFCFIKYLIFIYKFLNKFVKCL